MPTDTEKLSDAELAEQLEAAEHFDVCGEAARRLTARNDTIASLEKINKGLVKDHNSLLIDGARLERERNAANDTIARVTKVLSFVGCDERITVEGLAEAITKALTPTQPEASEPAATAPTGCKHQHVEHAFAHTPYCKDCRSYIDPSEDPYPPKPPAPAPDSPERCAHHVVQWNAESELWFCVHCKAWAKTADNWHFDWQPPTAPPETRTATLKHARELAMAGLEHAESARAKAVEDEARAEPETRDAARARAIDGETYGLAVGALQETAMHPTEPHERYESARDTIKLLRKLWLADIEARAAAAGGKRNE